MCWLTADWVIPRLAAAAEKESDRPTTLSTRMDGTNRISSTY
jgi:hypothetical protein